MIDALLKRKERADRNAGLRVGTIAAAIYNSNPFRRAGSREITAEDFVPQVEPSEEEKLAQFKAFFGSLKQNTDKEKPDAGGKI